jgi:hypothetical protein
VDTGVCFNPLSQWVNAILTKQSEMRVQVMHDVFVFAVYDIRVDFARESGKKKRGGTSTAVQLGSKEFPQWLEKQKYLENLALHLLETTHLYETLEQLNSFSTGC